MPYENHCFPKRDRACSLMISRLSARLVSREEDSGSSPAPEWLTMFSGGPGGGGSRSEKVSL